MPLNFNKERVKKIFNLSTPIIIGMISQNTLNLVDTAMVGRLGASSLAAVGISSMMVFMIQALVLGITSGVQALAARKKGEGKIHDLAQAINSGLLFSFIFGLIITVIALASSNWLFSLVADDPEVRILAKDYFDIRMIVTVFAVGNFAFRGFWNAIDASKTYMTSLIITHLLNIVLNYILIFGNWGFPALGVKGSSLATSIAVVIGFFIYLIALAHKAEEIKYNFKLPNLDEIKDTTKISFTSGFETFLTMINVVAQYWLVGKIGTPELAALNILLNIMMVAFLPAIAFGISLATLSGQALGRNDRQDSYEWGFDILRLAFWSFILVSIPMTLFAKNIIAIFTNDIEVTEHSILILQIMGITLPLEMLGFILLDAFKGLGKAKLALQVSFIMQWIYFFPLALLFVFVFKWGLLSVWLVQASYHMLQSLWLFLLWKNDRPSENYL